MIGGENMTDTQIPNSAVPGSNPAQPTISEVSVQQPVPQAPVQPVVTAPVVSTTPVATPAPVQPIETDNQRTRDQFEKILESNKALYETNQLLRQELEQRRSTNQQFAPVQLPPVPNVNQQPTADQNDFVEVDPYTGEKVVNTDRLNSYLKSLSQRASKAEEAVQRYVDATQQKEIERQNKEAFSAYPELNPTAPNHDVSFHNQTRAIIYDAVLNPQDYGGTPLSFKEAADYVRSLQAKGKEGEQKLAEAQQQAQTQQEAAVDIKQQASASPQGEQVTQRPTQLDDAEIANLKLRTRLGDPDALAIRLANSDHVRQKDTSS